MLWFIWNDFLGRRVTSSAIFLSILCQHFGFNVKIGRNIVVLSPDLSKNSVFKGWNDQIFGFNVKMCTKIVFLVNICQYFVCFRSKFIEKLFFKDINHQHFGFKVEICQNVRFNPEFRLLIGQKMSKNWFFRSKYVKKNWFFKNKLSKVGI